MQIIFYQWFGQLVFRSCATVVNLIWLSTLYSAMANMLLTNLTLLNPTLRMQYIFEAFSSTLLPVPWSDHSCAWLLICSFNSAHPTDVELLQTMPEATGQVNPPKQDFKFSYCLMKRCSYIITASNEQMIVKLQFPKIIPPPAIQVSQTFHLPTLCRPSLPLTEAESAKKPSRAIVSYVGSLKHKITEAKKALLPKGSGYGRQLV